MPDYHKITCETACSKIQSQRLPYRWDLNVYRGCEHACRYCFAVYSHRYIESGSFFGDIYVKENIVEKLERQLASPRWTGNVINVGGVTDSYQPAEEQFKIMPDVLKLMIKYRNPVIISTKSDLILRDFDLLCELAALTYVGVACTITTTDETVARRLEPGAVSSARRFEVLRSFKDTEVSTGLHTMPVIPYLTDSSQNLESLFRAGAVCGVDYAIFEPLNLRGETKRIFLNFVRKEYPHYYSQISSLYPDTSLDHSYLVEMYRRINELRKKYGVPANYRKPMTDRLKQLPGAQLSLF